ncbi:uncharacterized protein LOC108831207 [Raphanus sativus]|uniref:Uncharacterized protein LOC108831207 n=1 Tax=Raphanus sativus TaxID=3726 RepID=A0A6J0LJV0_RAPSA|nr:uncharacterized protein LOC108831207 [Raphanus sativus]
MATSAAPDIDLAIEETRRTPFTDRISGMKLSTIGKIKFPEYSGNSDPKAHIRAFRVAISRTHLNDNEKEAGYCRFFAENLTGSALEWFAGLEENSIDNFTQLVSAFLKQYSVFIKTITTEADLWNLKQAPFEPLRAYINKFREIKAKIANLNDGVALAALKNAYEEDVANLKEQFLASKNAASKKASTTKEAPTKDQHSYAIDNSTKNKSSIKPTLADRVTKLRQQLEEARPYELRNRKKNSTQQPSYKLSGGQRQYHQSAWKKKWLSPAINRQIIRHIDFIYGGSKFCNSVNSIKAHQRRAERPLRVQEPLPGPDHEITFDENETAVLDQPHDDALVLRLDVGGCELSRIIIDTGSSADVLFYDAFKRMGFIKNLLKQEPTPLIGFAGETTYSLGSIELAVTAGDVRKIVEFIVIDRPEPFNAILGRPWLYSMKAVPSTYHQCLKFPTPKGIETIRGSQRSSWTCYLASFKDIESHP